MAKFQFIGSDRSGASNPQGITAFGVTFAINGEPQEVTNALAVDKLRANTHFVEVGGAETSEGDGDDVVKDLRAAYREKAGKNPGPKWDEETLRAKLLELGE